jgi:hypothetical protein
MSNLISFSNLSTLLPAAAYYATAGFDAIPLIGKTPEKNLLVPSPKKLRKFLSEFSKKTYLKEREFVTIGELSQGGNASDSKSLTNIASKVFITAYLPVSNLY